MRQMFAFVRATIFVFAVCGCVLAQTAAEVHKKIVDTAGEKNYPAAIAHLRDLIRSDKRVFELNNYDYLLARLLEKNGDVAGAMAVYQAAASRGSILKPYALWHLSQIARGTGNLPLERTYLNELAASGPDSILGPAAENRLVRSFFESGDYQQVINNLSTLKISTVNGRSTESFNISRENLVLMGTAHLQLGRSADAKNIFARILEQTPNPGQPDDFALTAVENLDVIERTSPTELTDYDHLRRATVYQFNRSFESARRHYQMILAKFPQSGIMPDATFQIGRSYSLQGEYIESVNWFERALEQYPENPVAKDALLQAASVYARLGKYRESISRYKRFIDTYPTDERLERAYLNIIDVLRDQGEENEALAWSAKTQQAFRHKVTEAVALFSDARLYIARGDWNEALTALEKLASMTDLGGARVPGGTNPQEVTFLRGYIYERLGRFPEAIESYLSIPDGRNEYYGWRATARLRDLANNEQGRSFVADRLSSMNAATRSKEPETARRALQSSIRLATDEAERGKLIAKLRDVYRSIPAYNKVPSFASSELGRTKILEQADAARTVADELLFLGLCDEAVPAYEMMSRSGSVTNSYLLAKCAQKGDHADRAVAFIEPLWRNIPADFQIELIPRDQLELLYPAPYRESLIQYAPPREVDPRFVLSIMRQESRFRPDVKSYAAARGLMQFISSTANATAGKLGRKNFHQKDLYDPATSILFGSQYLSDLFKIFPDQPAAVAASYNGGDDNVKRWVLRSRSNIADQYVPEIIFTQSKDYVYKVLSSYRIYRFLYDENLKRKE